jgi:hypothetical protein
MAIGVPVSAASTGISGDLVYSSGMVAQPVLTVNSSTYDVTLDSSGLANLFNNSTFQNRLSQYAIPSADLGILADSDATHYVYVDYNSGSPIYKMATDSSLINASDTVPCYTISRVGSNVFVLNWDSPGLSPAAKLATKDVLINRFNLNSGLVPSVDSSLKVTSSPGTMIYGLKELSINQFDSSMSARYKRLTYTSGAFSLVNSTTMNNTYYSDGTNMITATAAYYVVNWLCMAGQTGADSSFLVEVMGGGQYITVAAAEGAAMPSLPSCLSPLIYPIYKAIILKGATTATIERISSSAGSGIAGANKHNSLLNIEGGSLDDSSGQHYYHATRPSNYRYVSKNGNDTSGDGGYANPFLTVQAAINEASSGMTVFVYPGSYSENVTFKAGVNVTSPVAMGVYIIGNHTCATAGTIILENIVLSSATGDTLSVSGSGAINFQMYSSSANSGTGYAINWNSTSSSSKLLLTDCTVNVSTSGASASALYTQTGSAGSIIANRTSFAVDNLNNVCLKLGGAVSFTHTSDQINGQAVLTDTAAAVISLVKFTTTSVAVATIGATSSAIINSVIVTTTASPAVTGSGLLYFAALVYGSTGVGGAQTLSGGYGPLPLKFASISFRSSALNTVPYDGTFEYDGTNLWFTCGTTRRIVSNNTRMLPLTNSTTALSLCQADGTVLFYVDTTSGIMYPATTNSRAIGTVSAALSALYTRLISSDDALSITSAETKALSMTSGTIGAITVDSGTTGAVNLGTGGSAKTITIGNTTGATAVKINTGSGNATINGGNVGIGTTSPSCSLTLGDSSCGTWDSNYKVIDILGCGTILGSHNGTGWSGTEYGQTAWANNTYYNGTSKAIGTGAASSILQGTGQIEFQVAPSVSAGATQTFISAMHINNSGYVGIGTNSSLQPLHVAWADQSHSRIRIENTNSDDGGRPFELVAGINTTGQSGFSIFDAKVSATRLVIDNSGRVIIGGTTGTSMLQVIGLPTYADNTSAIAGGLTAGAFYRTSTGQLMCVY